MNRIYIRIYVYTYVYVYMFTEEGKRNTICLCICIKKFFCNHKLYIFNTFFNAQFLTCSHRIILVTSFS